MEEIENVMEILEHRKNQTTKEMLESNQNAASTEDDLAAMESE